MLVIDGEGDVEMRRKGGCVDIVFPSLEWGVTRCIERKGGAEFGDLRRGCVLWAF